MMIKYKNLTVLGTSHISVQSIKDVSSFIKNNTPDIIALELDAARFIALTDKRAKKSSLKDVIHLGLKGFILNQIGAYIEKKLGKLVGVSPGSEMKEAIKLAKEYNLKIELIDQRIDITLKKLTKSITLKEKFRFVIDLISGTLYKKKRIKIDLTKVPDESFIIEILEKIKFRYPSFYNVLIDERNKIMAKNLNKIILNNKQSSIFAIVGAGHLSGLLQEIKKSED
ncbi:MAG TPA: TraB/GumN family protein [Candidatus Nanoarchaeia archaeon]|nr:TraB/GumN family protein [Candidatus Nanoarchaeia archaeon]